MVKRSRGQACGRHVKGVMTGQGYRYDGDWADDKQHGEGERE